MVGTKGSEFSVASSCSHFMDPLWSKLQGKHHSGKFIIFVIRKYMRSRNFFNFCMPVKKVCSVRQLVYVEN